MASTCSQTFKRYERLKRSTTVLEPRMKTGKHVRDCASYILTMYPIVDESKNMSCLTTSRKEEIWSKLKSFLPSPESIRTVEFFNALLFPIQLLRGTAQLYELDKVPDGLQTSLQLESRETVDGLLITHVWFMHLLKASLKKMKTGVDIYRQSRTASRLSTAINNATDSKHIAMVPDNATVVPTSPTPDTSDALAEVVARLVPPEGQSIAPGGNVTEGQEGSGAENGSNGRSHVNATGIPDDTRKVNYVFQHFKANRFTGDLRQSIELTLRDYNFCARHHRLSSTQRPTISSTF